THQRVVQAGSADLFGPERGVRSLRLPLEHQAALLRSMEERQMYATAIDPEVVEESGSVRRGAVRGPPQREAVGQRIGTKRRLREHVDVVGPLHVPVEVRGAVP